MATIPSTIAEFRRDCVKFMGIMGDKRHTQEQVAGAHRCLTLRYLGLQDVTQPEVESCALHLRIATEGAHARGWEL